MMDEYNYISFLPRREHADYGAFADHALRAGGHAPDFLLEDLETGKSVRLAELWSAGLAVIEFGSFT